MRENNYEYPRTKRKQGQLEINLFLAKYQAAHDRKCFPLYSPAILASSHEIQSAHNEDRPRLIPNV